MLVGRYLAYAYDNIVYLEVEHHRVAKDDEQCRPTDPDCHRRMRLELL